MIYIQHTASGIRAELEPFDGGVAYGEVGSGWRPIESAPFNTPVEIKAGSMTFLARLMPDASMSDLETSCDQWQAEIEGEHPPCWSGGACWSSNENEDPSLQPTAWRVPGTPSVNNELVDALGKIIAHFDRDISSRSAPGHSHRIPGVWDADISNGAKGGTACEWCAEWAGFRALLTRVKGDGHG